MAAGHGAIHVRRMFPHLPHGRRNGRFGGVVAVGEAQTVLQIAARLQVPPQGVATEQFEGLPCDLRRDERIAVAVAADPRAKTEETAHMEGIVAVVPGEGRAQIAEKLRHDLPQRSGHVQVATHFFQDTRPQRPYGLGFPEAHQVALQPLQEFLALAAQQVAAVERLQRFAHAAQQAPQRHPLGFRRVGREDGADVELIEQLLHPLRRQARAAERVHSRADRFAPRGGKGRVVAQTQDPYAMAVFGQVHQFQVAAFHAHELLQLGDVQPREALFHGRRGLGITLAPGLRQTQEAAGQVEQFARAVFADHAGQFPTEQPHVAAQESFVGGTGKGSDNSFHSLKNYSVASTPLV